MSDESSVGGVQVTPVPSDEEAAAIVAAIQVGLPGAGGEPPRAPVSRWRFSGRWWTRPIPARRTRPSA